MTLTMETSRMIDAPLSLVWEIISDLGNYHRHPDRDNRVSGEGHGAIYVDASICRATSGRKPAPFGSQNSDMRFTSTCQPTRPNIGVEEGGPRRCEAVLIPPTAVPESHD